MKLRAWLAQTKTTYAAFGAAIGLDKTQVCRIALGQRQPDIDMAITIERATGGKVTVHDFATTQEVAA